MYTENYYIVYCELHWCSVQFFSFPDIFVVFSFNCSVSYVLHNMVTSVSQYFLNIYICIHLFFRL